MAKTFYILFFLMLLLLCLDIIDGCGNVTENSPSHTNRNISLCAAAHSLSASFCLLLFFILYSCFCVLSLFCIYYFFSVLCTR